jgi:NitT/TauT family transport system ATP-binding protein
VEHLNKAIISTKKLSKAYLAKGKEFEAVKDFTIDIYEKEFVCIMGPSGCGKTSILKMLCGIEEPTSGTMMIDGISCDNKFPAQLRKKIGIMYQNDNLLPWRSVEANLRLPLEIFKDVDENTPQKIDNVLKMVGLADYKEVTPIELSGGMRQRVGIARAMVYDPDIVLMDQPFGKLDAITRRMLGLDFTNIWEKTQKTFIMVTNSVDEAILCSQKVIILSKCPAQVIKTVDVNIPINQRTSDIEKLPEYQRLRKELQELVRA